MSGALCTKHFALWLTALTAMAGVAGAQVSAPKTSPQSIVLPLEIVSGQPATLAVLSTDGRIVAGVKLVLSNGEVVTTDESGRAHFLGPPDAGVLIARILGTEMRAAADVVHPTAEKLEIATALGMVALKERFTIAGNGFQGDADRNQVELGGKSAFVLAGSPTELVILASSTTVPGSLQLTVKTGESEVSAQTALVDVSPDTIRDIVGPGKKGKLVLHITGTTQSVGLDVRNLSPEIVAFRHDERAHVRTRGGTDNSATIEVKALRAGDFSYAATLEPEAESANVQAARDFLQAADKLANGDEKRHIGNILAKVRPGHVDIRAARKEFAKITAANSSSDLQALICAAGDALNGR